MRSYIQGGLITLFLVPTLQAVAQISPPGMGTTHIASWFAVGVKQQLDTLDTKQWSGYVGYGRKGDPDEFVPFHRSGILVVTQEYQHRFRTHWQYAGGLSYRHQALYAKDAPFELSDPGAMEEIRFYAKYAYVHRIDRWKLSATLRQEIRKFYTPQFTDPAKDLELRTRLKLSTTYTLSERAQRKLILGMEHLFVTGRTGSFGGSWSPFRHSEDRLTLFYTQRLGQCPLEAGVGYMTDIKDRSRIRLSHYFAFTVQWNDPFGTPIKARHCKRKIR